MSRLSKLISSAKNPAELKKRVKRKYEKKEDVHKEPTTASPPPTTRPESGSTASPTGSKPSTSPSSATASSATASSATAVSPTSASPRAASPANTPPTTSSTETKPSMTGTMTRRATCPRTSPPATTVLASAQAAPAARTSPAKRRATTSTISTYPPLFTSSPPLIASIPRRNTSRSLPYTDAADWVLDELCSDLESYALAPSFASSSSGPSLGYGYQPLPSWASGPGAPSPASLTRASIVDNKRFFDLLPPATLISQCGRLEYPIIIPQKRPGTRERGFVAAWARELGEFGIGERMWAEFLQGLAGGLRNNPAMDVLTLGFPLSHAASSKPITSAFHLAVNISATQQRSRRTKSFLDAANDRFFKPRRLYALVISFKPENPEPIGAERIFIDDACIAEGGDALDGRMAGDASMGSLAERNRPGELLVPQAAPLRYPVLDSVGKERWERSGRRIDGVLRDYFERRATEAMSLARRKSQKSASVNGIPYDSSQFLSRYSDPMDSSKKNSNPPSFMSAFTCGIVKPKPRGETEADPKSSSRNADEREKELRRVLKQNVLYLAIVNLPNANEVADAREILEATMKKQGREREDSGTGDANA